MNWNKLLGSAKRLALRAAQREIARILAKAEAVPGLTAEAADAGVILSGKNLKARAVSDPNVRDLAQ
jgi:hypothetical protein